MEASILIVGVVVVASVGLGVAWVRAYGRFYQRLFSQRHYLEVATAVIELRAAALGHLAAPEAPTESISGAVSSEGLALSYSIVSTNTLTKHHFAVSLRGRSTPHAVGDRFLFMVAKFAGLPIDKVAFFSTESTVHHGEALLTIAEQHHFAARAPRLPTDAEITALLDEFARNRSRCRAGAAG